MQHLSSKTVGSSGTDSGFLMAEFQQIATPRKQDGRIQWNREWAPGGKISKKLQHLSNQTVGSSGTNRGFLMAEFRQIATPPKQDGGFQWNREWVPGGRISINGNTSYAKWSAPAEPRMGGSSLSCCWALAGFFLVSCCFLLVCC